MIDLNKFFNLIKEAKKSGYYSDHEINFFYDIWKAEEIVKKSLTIAADICIYTNHNIIVEKIG